MIPADEVVRRDITVKTQKLEYTSDQGQKHSVAVSSNSDDSSMLMYFDFFGDSQRAVVQRGEDGEYVVKEGTFSEADAVKQLYKELIMGKILFIDVDGTLVNYDQLITPEQCRHVVDWLHARGLEFYLESNNGLYKAFAHLGLLG